MANDIPCTMGWCLKNIDCFCQGALDDISPDRFDCKNFIPPKDRSHKFPRKNQL